MAKKLIYIANVRMPTEKAHGLQIMKMCEAFSNLGYDVELLSPFRFNKIKRDSFDFYGVKKNFKIKKIFSLDILPLEKFLGKISFYTQNISFAKRAALYCLFNSADIIFTRNLYSALILSFLGKKVCFEVHDNVPINFWTRKFLKNISQFVSTNNYKKDELIKNFIINPEKILIAPNGVDLEEFNIREDREECRKKLNLPQDEKIILYTGHLYGWKGVDVLFETAKKTKEYLFGFVGGTDGNIEKYRFLSKDFKNIKFFGLRPHAEIPYWLKAADLLILPNSKRINTAQFNATSPIKLFEYMASGTPIIATRVSSILELIIDGCVYLVGPDDPRKLAEKIKEVFDNEEKAINCAEKAKEKAKEFTWQKRAQKITPFLNNDQKKIQNKNFFNSSHKTLYYYKLRKKCGGAGSIIKRVLFVYFVQLPIIFNIYRYFYRRRVKKVFKISDKNKISCSINLETYNICNGHCVMCPYDKMTRPKIKMSMELYKKIIDDLSENKIRYVTLSFYSEPLLDPDIFERIKYAEEKELKVKIFTNGYLLTKDAVEKILNNPPSRLIISVGATNPETEKKIRKGSDLNIVRQNIKRIAYEKKRRNAEYPQITTVLVAQDLNFDEVEEYKKEWSGVVDRVDVNIDNMLVKGVPSFFKHPFPCTRIFTQFFITSSGKVALCCNDYDCVYSLGDFNNQNFKQIFFGQIAENYKNFHRKCEVERLELCKKCVYAYDINSWKWWGVNKI